MVDIEDKPGLFARAGSKLLVFAGGLVLLALVVAAFVWWFGMTDAEQDAYSTSVWNVILWTGFALVLPWGLFFVPALVLKAEHNLASVAMLVAYAAIDVVAWLWLWEWTIPSAANAVGLLIGLGLASGYNYIVSESLARVYDR